MTKYIAAHPQVAIVMVCIVLFCLHLNIFPVKIMEARNFVTAREMVSDGHWLLTTLNGEPRYEKPPLPAWLSAVSAIVSGTQSVLAYRLPISLMAIFTVLAFYQLMLSLSKSKEMSLLATLVLATSFYFMAIQREAPVDIFAHGFMVASLYFLYQLVENINRTYRHATLAALFFGLSFLSKGPVAHYAMLLPFVIAYAFSYPIKNIKQKILPFILMALVATILSGWWFMWVRVADPDSFTAIVNKETENWSNYHIRPFYYYWSFFTQSGLWTIPAFVSLLYPYLKDRISNKKLYQFAWLWTILAVVLLSLIPEKKPRYLVPVLFPLAITTALYLDYFLNNLSNPKMKYERAAFYFHFGLLIIIAFCFPFATYYFLIDSLPGYWIWYVIASIFSVGMGSYLLRNLVNGHFRHAFYTSILFYIGLFGLGFPMVKTMYDDKDILKLKTIASQAAQNNLPVYSFGELAPEVVWAFGKTAPTLGNTSIKIPDTPSFGILAKPENESNLLLHFETTHNLRLIAALDISKASNVKKTGSSQYLLCNYYILTKKNND